MITVSATWTSLETYKYLVKNFRMKNKHFGEEIKPLYSSNNTREDSTHGNHQMANIEIKLIIFFAAKDGEAL